MKTLLAIPGTIILGALLAVATVGVVVAVTTAPSNLRPYEERVLGKGIFLTWTLADHEDYTTFHTIDFWETGQSDNRSVAFVSDGVYIVGFATGFLKPGVEYNFQVKSLKSDGNGNFALDEHGELIYGGASNIVKKTMPAPSAKRHATSLNATKDGDDVVLTWTGGSANNIESYKVRRRVRGGGWTTFTVDSDATSYTDTTVESGNRYIYRVETWNKNGKKIGVSKPAQIRVN